MAIFSVHAKINTIEQDSPSLDPFSFSSTMVSLQKNQKNIIHLFHNNSSAYGYGCIRRISARMLRERYPLLLVTLVAIKN